MHPLSFASTVRSTDLITSAPLADAEQVLDLGVRPIPGLFFPDPALASEATSRVRLMLSRDSGLWRLDRDVPPAAYSYYKSGRATPSHLDHVERTADAVARDFPRSARILEIGGGPGCLARALIRRGFLHLHIVDPAVEFDSEAGCEVLHGVFPDA